MENFKKFTEDEWNAILEKGNVYDFLVDKVANALNNDKSNYEARLTDYLWKCESPIEQLLYLEMLKLTYSSLNSNPYVDVIAIDNQVEVNCGDEKYRVDFLIPVEYINPFSDNRVGKFYVVECDGHEFHEKTKQQVINDNKRTRKLQEYGFQVIRYSGSEIYNSSHRCATNLFNIIYSYFWNNILSYNNIK